MLTQTSPDSAEEEEDQLESGDLPKHDRELDGRPRRQPERQCDVPLRQRTTGARRLRVRSFGVHPRRFPGAETVGGALYEIRGP